MEDLISIDNLPTISPEEIHRNNLAAFAVGNRAHHILIAGITALQDMDGWKVLGSASAGEYGKKYFGYKRAMTYERIRVARKLAEIPALAAPYREGKVSFSSLREITRIVKPETVGKWVAYAEGKTSETVAAGVRQAIENGRGTPPEDGYGLPEIRLRLPWSFSLEEYAIIEKVTGKYRAEVRERLGPEEDLGAKEMFLGMLQLFLETEPSGLPAGREPAAIPPYHVLYHVDLMRGRAFMETDEGWVEVPAERVAAVEGDAERVAIGPEDVAPAKEEKERGKKAEAAPRRRNDRPIDRPNTRTLVRRVRLLDGNRCAVPGCPHRDHLHAHHIIHREDHGRTEVWNEISLCNWHHAIAHAGYLRIEITPEGKVRFIRRGDEIRLDLEDPVREVRALPLVRVESTCVDSEPGRGGKANGRGQARRDGPEDPLEVLWSLGIRSDVAAERLRLAREALAKEGKVTPTPEDVLQAALEGRGPAAES